MQRIDFLIQFLSDSSTYLSSRGRKGLILPALLLAGTVAGLAQEATVPPAAPATSPAAAPAVPLAEPSETSLLDEAARAFQAEDMEKAGELLSAWLSANPNDPAGIELQAKMLARAGRHDEAIKVLLGVLKSDPHSGTIRLTIGDLYAVSGKPRDAIEYYGRHLETNQGSKDAIMRLVFSFTAVGDTGTAAQWLTRLNPEDDTHPGYYFGRALIDFAKGDEPAAESTLAQARTLYGGELFSIYEQAYINGLKVLLAEKSRRGKP